MLLYQRRGYENYTTEGDPTCVPETKALLKTAEELLRRRGKTKAADHLARVPFHLRPASNEYERDASLVLYAVLRLSDYERVRSAPAEDYETIAKVLAELKHDVCRVEIELALVPLSPGFPRGSEPEMK